MNIGIYGGTFNPIHNGHIHVLGEFFTRLSLDKALLIPTRVPPHKAASDLASPKDRLAMCGLAAMDMPLAVEVSAIEIERKKKSYTVDTLLELHSLYAGANFFLLMGEDMFMTVDKWYKSEIIFSLCTVCASPRSEDGLARLREYGQKLQERYPSFQYRVENVPFMDVSSTQVRSGKSDWIPSAVAAYIKENHLYEEV